jgi:glycosyltransferase involved in cell wall biosynthesis
VRILLVSGGYPPGAERSAPRYVTELARSLLGSGHDAHVVTANGTDQCGHVNPHGIPTHLIRQGYPFWAYNDCLQTVLMNLPLSETLCEVWRSEGPFDLLAAHDWTSSLAACLAQRVFGAPLVATLHGTQAGRAGGRPTPEDLYIGEMEGWLCRRADRVVVPSDAVCRDIEDRYSVPFDRVAVSPRAVRADAFQAEVDREEFRSMFARPDEPLLLFVGRLAADKGPDLLIEALAGLVRRGIRARLVLAGEGPLREALAATIEERGLSDRVRMTGFLGRAVLGALYSIADLLVVPSRYEPFGTAILEALVYGLPVLASQGPAVSELAEAVKSDLLKPVAANDVQALEESLARELSMLSARPADRAPRQSRIPERFGWETVSADLVRVYESLPAAATR